jgi:fluoride ion exporter CrcB/FEX
LHGLIVLGFAGGLSTWSSLAVDVAGMIRERRWKRVALHIPVAFACAVAIFLAIGFLSSGHAQVVAP